MTAPEVSGNAARYTHLDDPILADTLAREDDMDDAWHSGGSPGSPPRRDTCHGCASWADHNHDEPSGRRVELEPADLDDRRERAMERAVLADMAYDPDEAAWALYERLQALDEQRAREGAAAWVDRYVAREREQVER